MIISQTIPHLGVYKSVSAEDFPKMQMSQCSSSGMYWGCDDYGST